VEKNRKKALQPMGNASPNFRKKSIFPGRWIHPDKSAVRKLLIVGAT